MDINGRNANVIRGFVVFEGIDGTGTTTQLRLLEARLSRAGRAVWTTAEPTDSPIGSLIRRVLKGEIRVHPDTVARLFAADRGEHLFGKDGIVERTARGELVVCDRYLFSSLAYQGVSCGDGLPRALNADFPLPELVFHFRIDPSSSFERVKARGDLDIYERLEFQHRVSEAYGRVFGEFAGCGMRIVEIDAALPIAAVAEAVAREVDIIA